MGTFQTPQDALLEIGSVNKEKVYCNSWESNQVNDNITG